MAVYDDLTDRRIECHFSKKMKETVKPALGLRVSVYGIGSYRRDGQQVSIHVKEIKVLSEDNFPTFEDMKGILKD